MNGQHWELQKFTLPCEVAAGHLRSLRERGIKKQHKHNFSLNGYTKTGIVAPVTF